VLYAVSRIKDRNSDEGFSAYAGMDADVSRCGPVCYRCAGELAGALGSEDLRFSAHHRCLSSGIDPPGPEGTRIPCCGLQPGGTSSDTLFPNLAYHVRRAGSAAADRLPLSGQAQCEVRRVLHTRTTGVSTRNPRMVRGQSARIRLPPSRVIS